MNGIFYNDHDEWMHAYDSTDCKCEKKGLNVACEQIGCEYLCAPECRLISLKFLKPSVSYISGGQMGFFIHFSQCVHDCVRVCVCVCFVVSFPFGNTCFHNQQIANKLRSCIFSIVIQFRIDGIAFCYMYWLHVLYTTCVNNEHIEM